MRWSVTVFAKNEAASIQSCLDAICAASEGTDTHLSVIVNGSTDDTTDKVRDWQPKNELNTEIFQTAVPSKANAWNAFIHKMRPDADIYFFVDAYARVEPDAFRRLADALEQNPYAHAASSIPATGRSAAKVSKLFIQYGGMHGTLHALRRSFVEEIVERGLRQPFGLYRGDGLIGSIAMHDFDPRRNAWNKDLVALIKGTSWTHKPLSLWRTEDLQRHFNRLINQARGKLENAAIREIINEHGFEALPDHADVMISDWLKKRSAAELFRLKLNPFTRMALGRLQPENLPVDANLELIPMQNCISA